MGLRKDVDMMCKACSYDSTQPGSWRQQTEDCTVRTCPLWKSRPVTMETTLARRKDKSVDADLDAIVDGLDDE